MAGTPNVVFILVDDLGYTDVGVYNPETFYDTPNIDKLGASGIKFTNGYQHLELCRLDGTGLCTTVNEVGIS